MKKQPRTPNPTELEIAAACVEIRRNWSEIEIAADPSRRHAATSRACHRLAAADNQSHAGRFFGRALNRHGIRVVHRLRVETGNLPLAEIRMQAAARAVELAREIAPTCPMSAKRGRGV